jgi:heptosyltransferase-2
VRILLVHPGVLGDAVFLGPAVRALKTRWPDAEVAICTTPRGAPAARLLPGCQSVVVLDKRGRDGGLGGLRRVGLELRRFRPDLALVSHASLRSGALAWLSGAPRRIGYPPLFCTERVPLDRNRPFVDRALALAERAGAESADRTLRMAVPVDGATYAERVLAGASRPVVALLPGAEWPTKRWGPEKFAILAQHLAARGATLVLLGGPVERALCRRVAELSGFPVRDTAGNSIEEAIALLARCDLVVGGDTGLVHCARALGRRTLVLFGPTDPTRHLWDRHQEPIRLGLECQPCHDHGPERCPLGHLNCLNLLSALAVAEAARGLLDAPAE